MFRTDYPLADANPAPYNPRRIDAASRAALRESIASLGLIRPVIVTDTGTLLAGHQRTVALKSLGIERVPAYVLSGVAGTDEVRFNQMHNAGDMEVTDGLVRIAGGVPEGWSSVAPERIVVVEKGRFTNRRQELLLMLNRYGEFSSAVVTAGGPDSDVLVGGLYADACRILHRPLRVYGVPASKAEEVRERLGRSYGVFSYGHLPKTTWVQTLAQPYRLRGETHAQSTTYENAVLPEIRKEDRLLDFGAGQMDYVRLLRSRGLRARGLEFYLKAGAGFGTGKSEQKIDVARVHRDVDVVCEDLRREGRYDVLVCDSVLNSVDSMEAARDVLNSLNALSRPGGRIVFSGKTREAVDYRDTFGAKTGMAYRDRRREVVFCDEDGFTANMRYGEWFYQFFQRKAVVEAWGREFVGPDAEYRTFNGHTTWVVSGTKAIERPREEQEAALAREFDLPLPGGKRYGRSADILAAFRAALAREGAK